MKSSIIKLIILGAMLLGLPILGVTLAGYPVAEYLEFPPETRFVEHASFSWIAFGVFTILILVSGLPFMIRAMGKRTGKKAVIQRSFPWWGWLGMGSLICMWALSWTRFSFFRNIQEYTFTPLWLSYIIVVNAMVFRRTGRCMMLKRPLYFLILFPFSAAFWWFFEYLNRFVQNWYYVGVHFGALKYFLLATISFSTVLPAVLGTCDLLLSTERIKSGFQNFFQVKPAKPKWLSVCILGLSALSLGGIGVFPDYLFPIVWVSPLLIILSLQTLYNEKHILSDIAGGNWTLVVSAALSAFICGIFWEMWNFYSLAKWEYSIPLVHRFKVFEMPVLGYAGYFPFGLECAAIGRIISDLCKWSRTESNQ